MGGIIRDRKKASKQEAELQRIAILGMPHTDRDKTKFKVRRKKKPRVKASGVAKTAEACCRR
jgi:hypothetical protein